jgi:hypothetical protein
MDPLIGVVTVLLLASASMFFYLSIADGRSSTERADQRGPVVALEDLVGARQPLFPHTIRQTPLD